MHFDYLRPNISIFNCCMNPDNVHVDTDIFGRLFRCVCVVFFFIRPLFYCTGWLSHKNFHGRSLMHMHTHADNSYEKWPKPAFRWHNKEIKITILFIDFVRWISSLGWAKKHCFTLCMCGGDEWKTNGMIIKFETITKNVIIIQNKSHFNAAKLKEVSTESRESTHFNKMWPFLHFL